MKDKTVNIIREALIKEGMSVKQVDSIIRYIVANTDRYCCLVLHRKFVRDRIIKYDKKIVLNNFMIVKRALYQAKIRCKVQ